jgi:hypothetical protein
MAYYKNSANLTSSSLDIYDKEWEPGQAVVYKGIHKCKGCEKEVTVNEQFPPQNHHQHSLLQGQIRWKLIVWARA